MNRAPRVLVVEDEQDIAGLIKHALERSGDGRSRSSAAATPRFARVTEQRPIWSFSISTCRCSAARRSAASCAAARQPPTCRSSC